MLIGNAVNQVLPSMVGGDAARIVLLNRRGIPLKNTVRQVGLDRFAGLCGLILTMAMTAPFVSGAVFDRIPAGVTWLLVGLFTLALIGCGGASLLLSKRRSGPPSRFITPLLNFGVQLWHGLERLMQAPAAGVLVVALSVANQASLATAFWFIAAAVGVHIDLAFALFIIPVVSVVMLVPVSISGWGVREAALVTALGFVNIPAAPAVAASVLFGLASVVYALISLPLFLHSAAHRAERSLVGVTCRAWLSIERTSAPGTSSARETDGAAAPQTPDVTLVIPVYNEQGNILDLFAEIEAVVRLPYVALIIYDHEEDDTLVHREALMAANPAIEFVRNAYGRGVVNAFKTGFGLADTPYIVPIMCDLSDMPETVNRLYEKIHEGYDLVVASRYAPGGGKIGGPKLKKFLSRTGNLLLHQLTGIPTHDMTNACIIYRKEVLDEIHIEATGGSEIAMGSSRRPTCWAIASPRSADDQPRPRGGHIEVQAAALDRQVSLLVVLHPWLSVHPCAVASLPRERAQARRGAPRRQVNGSARAPAWSVDLTASRLYSRPRSQAELEEAHRCFLTEREKSVYGTIVDCEACGFRFTSRFLNERGFARVELHDVPYISNLGTAERRIAQMVGVKATLPYAIGRVVLPVPIGILFGVYRKVG